MHTGKFVADRGFWLGNRPVVRGEHVALDDAALIADLYRSGKISPADAATARRLKPRSSVTWTKGEPASPKPRDPWRPIF